jgi:hypothetical protein
VWRFSTIRVIGSVHWTLKEVLPVAARDLGLISSLGRSEAQTISIKFFAAMSKQRPDGLYVPPDLPMRINEKRIIGFTLKHRLPSTYFYRDAVEPVGSCSTGMDRAVWPRRLASYVDRILKGAKPLTCRRAAKQIGAGDQSQNAKQIGVTIPNQVLERGQPSDQMNRPNRSVLRFRRTCWRGADA